MILFNIHLSTRGYVSDLGLDILGNYYLHGKILFTSVLATRGHVSGLGLDIYIYIHVQGEIIIYMGNYHLPLSWSRYIYTSKYKRK